MNELAKLTVTCMVKDGMNYETIRHLNTEDFGKLAMAYMVQAKKDFDKFATRYHVNSDFRNHFQQLVLAL